ncbi:hypothetical protein A2U01_0093243, partial [Trifolium medium]|nr:hypothetical protein [Trifolium medium]
DSAAAPPTTCLTPVGALRCAARDPTNAPPSRHATS